MIEIKFTFKDSENEQACRCLRYAETLNGLHRYADWLRENRKYGHAWANADEALAAISERFYELVRWDQV